MANKRGRGEKKDKHVCQGEEGGRGLPPPLNYFDTSEGKRGNKRDRKNYTTALGAFPHNNFDFRPFFFFSFFCVLFRSILPE